MMNLSKVGLTPIDSDIVKPKRVKESPFQMECKLLEMKSYGRWWSISKYCNM